MLNICSQFTLIPDSQARIQRSDRGVCGGGGDFDTLTNKLIFKKLINKVKVCFEILAGGRSPPVPSS